MSSKSIIIKPILTEKINELQESQNKYGFKVHPSANKIEIKKAVEDKFGVKVEKVATQNIMGKTKLMTVRSGGRVIRTTGRRSNWKKAIVTLKEGEKIDFYQGETAV
ncbi:MAG: 50S ribosomal protein L23 [Candidatus Marinimicrobia bacterium]|jgi:large subunit ribosomal protein L23|nr:50S ribosomal protein L23 [Candidatus Neomarinimicrobiota bacterium]OQC45183.1 MAG: 50S ribosomal protein L23 [Candidatus Marinimicrobia bacterium ADurb.Bin030]HRU78461.1 50S ribosomal protein L23 [Rectinema sp.]MBP9004847.1 50S ribosomal protein L23 [Candidatus Neomarinimicrobiota bacterium]HNZ36398.1 50S ribosomal protein L23 [Candidatus Neomarinimicrobiota bacterium]